MRKNAILLLIPFMLIGLAGNAHALIWGGNGHNYEAVWLKDTGWDDALNHLVNKIGSDYTFATITTAAEQGFMNNYSKKKLSRRILGRRPSGRLRGRPRDQLEVDDR